MAHGLELLICLRLRSLEFVSKLADERVTQHCETYDMRFSIDDSNGAVLRDLRKTAKFGA